MCSLPKVQCSNVIEIINPKEVICIHKEADAELDRMWNEGTLNEERIESFRHLHERTPYNKPSL